MANVNYTVVLDLTDNGCVQTGWRLKQGDSGNSTIIAKVVNNGVDAYDPNVTPEIAFKRADGNSVLSTMTASDGYYVYTFVGNELAIAGPVVMDVTLTDSEARTSTASCRFEVVADPAGYDPEGAHTYDNPVSVLVEEAKKDASDAEAWSSGTRNGEPVSSGDPTYHNNSKYWSEQANPTLLQNLQDVVLNSPTEGQALIYDATNDVWKNGNGGGGGSSTLSGLTDVNLESPISGEALIYDSLNQEWINGQAGATNLNGLTDVVITTPSNNQVLKYDDVNHVWKNANESGGSGGSTIKVTTTDATKFGEILILSDGVTTLTTAFSFSGEAIFSGVTMTGNLTLTCEGDSMVVSVPYFGNYDFVFSAFAATITVSYPTGATCTCVGGGESQTATSNPQVFTVHSANTYRVTATVDGVPKYQDVVITTDGQSETVSIAFGTINVALDADFIGETITCVNGGTTISKTASSTSLVFYPPTTGTWTISGTVSGTTYSVDAEVVDLSTPVSVSLETLQTVTVTLYSATEDTVAFTDASGVQKTEVFASGQSSKSIDITIQPNGQSITFTSSVAKNPDDLSQYYSKALTVTSSTTELYLMPENTLYWWGYNSSTNPIIAINSSDGWDYTSSGYTFNKNNVSASGTQGYAGICATNKIRSTKYHGIGLGNGYWGPNNLIILKGKQIKTSSTWSKYTGFETTISHKTVIPDDSDEYNLATSYGGTAQSWNWTIYALWYE